MSYFTFQKADIDSLGLAALVRITAISYTQVIVPVFGVLKSLHSTLTASG